MLKIPKILDTSEFLDAPLDYKWDEKTSEFYYVDACNDKISGALWALNHKATFGLAIALGEWVFWRISNHIDKGKLIPVFESHWAGLIDKHYMLILPPEEMLADGFQGTPYKYEQK